MKSILHKILALTVFAAVSASFYSCTKDEPSQQDEKLTLTIRTNPGASSSSQTPLYISSPGAWTLEFKESQSWASLSASSGDASSTLSLDFAENPLSQWREVTLVLRCGDKSVEKVFLQAGKGSPAINPDPIAEWMELPRTETQGLYFIHHPMQIGTKKTRNYSYYWDPSRLHARWVAYPQNQLLQSGSSGRTDQWDLDPKLAREYQPVLFNPFSGYQRGHQIPAADRKIAAYNIETFYGVNMTAQNGSLNGGVWAELEAYVRSRSLEVDTLYVVTGCLPGTNTVRDNDSKQVNVPSGYFKALLAYKKSKNIGITGKTLGYTGIGFYFENKNYSGSYMNESMTLSQLEQKTGMEFFVNLPSAIGSTLTEKVKTTQDNWWNK